MFKQGVETSRSEMFYQLAAYHPFFSETGAFPPIINKKSLELAHLFAEEERLAVLISEPQTVDKNTVYKVVSTAKKIATERYSTRLVPLDEMLDIAQIFCFLNTDGARIEQGLVLEDPQSPPFGTRLASTKFLDYAKELITSPDTNTANHILVKLLAKLKDTDNPAWTARVAAVLAYYSVLPPSTSTN